TSLATGPRRTSWSKRSRRPATSRSGAWAVCAAGLAFTDKPPAWRSNAASAAAFSLARYCPPACSTTVAAGGVSAGAVTVPVAAGDHPQRRRFYACPQGHEFSTIAAKLLSTHRPPARARRSKNLAGVITCSGIRAPGFAAQGPAGRAAYLRTAGGGEEIIELGPGAAPSWPRVR